MVSGVIGSLLSISRTQSFEIDGTTVLLDQNDGARHRACRNFIADVIADALQPFP